MSNQKKSFDKNRPDILKEMHVFRADEEENYLDYLQDDYCNADCYSRTFRPVSSRYTPNKGFEKYSNALKHLKPIRRKKKDNEILGIDESGFFSLITFSWMSNYIYRAYKKGLTLDDIPSCSQFDSCDFNAQRLESLWEKELVTKGHNKASFAVAVWKFVRTRILLGCFTFSMSCFMGFLSPTIFMRKLLEYLEDPEENQMYGVVWALALTCSEVFRTMFFALYYSMSYRTALRLRSACLAMVYRKLLRLNYSRTEKTGEIINLYGFDGPRLYYMVIFGPMAIGGPIISICGFLYIYYILGPWALLGMLIFISYYPTQYLLSHLTGYYRQKAVGQSDKRIKIMTEILTSMKFIKMYGWENWFSSRIHEVRKKELTELEKISYCQSVGISLAPTVPVISGIATFLIHVATGGNLAASQAFSILAFLTKQMKMSIQVIRDGSLSFYEGIVSVQRFKAYSILVVLMTQLRTALVNMRYGSENYVQGRIVCNRFQKVLMLEENPVRIPRPRDESLALFIKDGHFVWDAEHREERKGEEEEEERLAGCESGGPKVLHGIDLSVAKGALVGVCGPVGAGKSSLVLACLGQVKMSSGEMSRAGKCAYVSQQAWMENASFKNNILFGEAFDAKKYIKVLHACALHEDVNLLPGGDETEVGERGVNLSGGQKQRVALARALYADRDIYLLDDPFSALDPQVAVQVFEKYVLESLAGKTVVLVTRQIQFLQKCEEVLVMKGGRIVERGTYSHLATRGKEFGFMILSSSLASPHKEENMGKSEEERESRVPGREDKSEDGKFGLGKLTQAEEQIHGAVRSYAFRAYLEAAGGLVPCFFVVLIILLNVGSNIFSSWWLAMWIGAGSGNTTVVDPATNRTIVSRNINDNPDLPLYARTYGSIVVLIVATFIVRGLVYTKVTIRASRILHKNLFDKILDSPMNYFERTPIGQIQNLFARDMDEVDSRLPETLEMMLQNIWAIMFSFLSITLVFPWFLVPLLGLACLYYFISKVFRVAMRDMKRVESISRAPVFGAVSNTVQGLSTIHAFDKEDEFNSQFCKLFDGNATAVYLSSNAMRWMAVRLDSISVAIIFITSLSVALLKNEVVPAFAGLALTYAAQICGVFQYTIRLIAENEARFISVERIQKIIETLESEGNSQPEVKVLSTWPSDGAIKFHKVTLSYGPHLPNVLKGVSFDVARGEKIGVVGRTGAGKSSLVVALLRLVELTSGSILVDGLNIARVPLRVLRSRLSVIPQDPVLFGDTLRSNLDPFAIYDDTQLWDVLGKTKLSRKVKSMPNQMSTRVGEGESLSVGEKQLLCLARVLLRGSKILILDEATASIDPETEKAVQTTIQEEFKECTTITIAHRLSTVTNCDRVLVVDQGTVLEFDSPRVLLERPSSQFAKMWAAAEVH